MLAALAEASVSSVKCRWLASQGPHELAPHVEHGFTLYVFFHIETQIFDAVKCFERSWYGRCTQMHSPEKGCARFVQHQGGAAQMQ